MPVQFGQLRAEPRAAGAVEGTDFQILEFEAGFAGRGEVDAEGVRNVHRLRGAQRRESVDLRLEPRRGTGLPETARLVRGFRCGHQLWASRTLVRASRSERTSRKPW